MHPSLQPERSPDLALANAEAHEMAQHILGQMESLFLKEVPRVADSFGTVVRDLQERLTSATNEAQRVMAAHTELQRSYDALVHSHDAALVRNEELQRMHEQLSRLNAENEQRLDALQRSWDDLNRQHAEDAMRIAAVESFVKAFMPKQ